VQRARERSAGNGRMIVISEEPLGRLDRLVNEIGSLNSKLVLVIGPPDAGKSELLAELAERHQTSVLTLQLLF
jgi:polynucleotide 5'-kinase involved in rRNA processing